MSGYKKIFLCLFLGVISLCFSSSVFPEDEREDCRVCGMWIDQYLHTRHVILAADGTQISFCSFTCAAKYLKMNKTGVKQLQAADYLTTDLVDVKDAFYLVGSDVPPVMSYTSIIAFAGRESAVSFQQLHGGTIMTFVEVLDKQ